MPAWCRLTASPLLLRAEPATASCDRLRVACGRLPQPAADGRTIPFSLFKRSSDSRTQEEEAVSDLVPAHQRPGPKKANSRKGRRSHWETLRPPAAAVRPDGKRKSKRSQARKRKENKRGWRSLAAGVVCSRAHTKRQRPEFRIEREGFFY